VRCSQEVHGLRALAESLRFNTTLEMLDMQGCQLSEEGVAMLAGYLAPNRTLDLIRFDRCEIPVQILTGHQEEPKLNILPPDLVAAEEVLAELHQVPISGSGDQSSTSHKLLVVVGCRCVLGGEWDHAFYC
jgi:hypothetical protein